MKTGISRITGVLLVVSVLAACWWAFGPRIPAAWTEADLAVLRSLSIDSLPSLPADPSNAVADDPAAAAFGHRLFFDQRLSLNGAVSCATCHQPARQFTDGLRQGRGIALSGRNTRSIVGSAYSPWQYWDGRRDSLWSQALSPLEDPAEHGSNRMRLIRLVGADPDYRIRYESLFGAFPDFSDPARFPNDAAPLPGTPLADAWTSMQESDRHLVNTVYANIGKAIGAYERLIVPGPSRFDAYVRALDNGDDATAIFNVPEILGLQLFIDEARCTECHNGPLLTNNEFHNTGMLSSPGAPPDRGRIDGVRKVLADPFNCLGSYSDDDMRSCPELDFVRTGDELVGSTRTPSLRTLSETAPYGHKGQQETLADVLRQYNDSPLAMIGHNEAEFPLGLSRRELGWLEDFLHTLDAPLDTDPQWLSPPE